MSTESNMEIFILDTKIRLLATTNKDLTDWGTECACGSDCDDDCACLYPDGKKPGTSGTEETEPGTVIQKKKKCECPPVPTIFIIAESEVYHTVYDWIDQSVVEAELQKLFVYLQQKAVKCKGNILVYQRYKNTNDSVLSGQYNISPTEFSFENCELSIKSKTVKEPTPRLTDEQKRLLFAEYWQNFGRIPRSTEKYKNFNIGTYFHNARKNKELFDTLNTVANGQLV